MDELGGRAWLIDFLVCVLFGSRYFFINLRIPGAMWVNMTLLLIGDGMGNLLILIIRTSHTWKYTFLISIFYQHRNICITSNLFVY